MNKNQIHILAVDDDPDIRELLRTLLEAEGFFVTTAIDGYQALDGFHSQIDLVILDVAMPGEDGYSTCRKLRETSTVPILFLTARSQEQDKVTGFSCGGDDYLAKPFSKAELLSRIRALLRRCYQYQPPSQKLTEDKSILSRGQLTLHTLEGRAYFHAFPLNLTSTEYQLLELMVRHPQKVFSAQQLYESIWKEKYCHKENGIVIVHISNLRKKLGDDPKNPRYIKNMWGRGYYVD